MRNTSPALLLVALSLPALAAPPVANRNFVSCPIVRDTKTVPCWLAEYDGELYYLGIQTDISAAWYPPYQGHKVLVEGTVSDEPRICGGIVLKPVTTSTLPEMDPSCNQMIPASDEFTVPFAPRGPGPSNRGLAFAAPAPGAAGGTAAAPAPPRQPPPPPQPPYQEREFTIAYEFDAPFVTGRTSRGIQQAVLYSRQIEARKIEVVGYRGTVLLSDGKPFTEKDGIARQRAEQVGELLREVGVPAEKLNVRWINAPTRATGQEDFKQRRVTLLVQP